MLSCCRHSSGRAFQAPTLSALTSIRAQRIALAVRPPLPKEPCDATAGLVIGIALILFSLIVITAILVNAPSLPCLSACQKLISLIAKQIGCETLTVAIYGASLGGAITLLSLALPYCCKKRSPPTI